MSELKPKRVKEKGKEKKEKCPTARIFFSYLIYKESWLV